MDVFYLYCYSEEDYNLIDSGYMDVPSIVTESYKQSPIKEQETLL